MKNLEAIAGFNDLKSLFRQKLKISKPLEELYLWFAVHDGALYMHDMQDHKKSILLALPPLNEQSLWTIYLTPNSKAEKLILKIIIEHQVSGKSLASTANSLFKLCGQYPFRQMK